MLTMPPRTGGVGPTHVDAVAKLYRGRVSFLHNTMPDDLASIPDCPLRCNLGVKTEKIIVQYLEFL